MGDIDRTEKAIDKGVNVLGWVVIAVIALTLLNIIWITLTG